jgi:hypothetical protein
MIFSNSEKEKVYASDLKILEKWSTMIEDAKGRGEELLRETMRLIQEREVPGIEIKKVLVCTKQTLTQKAQEREYLMIVNNQRHLKDFKMYVGATDYGKNLNCYWYFTCEPGPFKKLGSILYSKLGREGEASPLALSFALNLFEDQDLTAYVTIIHHAVLDAVKEISQSVGFDFTKVDTKSRGFLNIA